MSTQAYLKAETPRHRSEGIARADSHRTESRTTIVTVTKEPTRSATHVGGAGWYEQLKTITDFVLAAVIFTISLPFLILAILAIRLTSKGSAIYTQVRVGQGGKPYVIYKLRSMYHDCERKSGIQWCTRGDPRVTPVGWFLRKTHIDELPQLWNVLRGEMSLIGPRPERPELVAKLEQDIPHYRDRLLVKPGLTGLAQIQLPPDTDMESVRNKLVLDRVYVSRRGLWLDLRIYVATAVYLAGVPFAKLKRWFNLPNEMRVAKPPVEVVTIQRRVTPLYSTVTVME